MAKYKLRLNKNVGMVILVVEGAKDEPVFLRAVLGKLLHYNVTDYLRNKNRVRFFADFTSKQNKNSRFVIINAKQSNIKSIKDYDEYRRDVMKTLLSEIGADLASARVYYLWDKDVDSNDDNLVRSLIYALQSPYENNDYEKGLLLLSYPAFESYKLSCIDDTSKRSSRSLKKLKNRLSIRMLRMTREKIVKATAVMDATLRDLGISYDLDNIGKANVSIYNGEKAIYSTNQYYRLLSLISFLFLDLGIIEEC